MRTFEEIKEEVNQVDGDIRKMNLDEFDEEILASVVDRLVHVVKDLVDRVDLLAEDVAVMKDKLDVEGSQ